MKTEYLSVKDFADRAGVSQQAIYKQLNNKLKKYVKVVENKKWTQTTSQKWFKHRIDGAIYKRVLRLRR